MGPPKVPHPSPGPPPRNDGLEAMPTASYGPRGSIAALGKIFEVPGSLFRVGFYEMERCLLPMHFVMIKGDWLSFLDSDALT